MATGISVSVGRVRIDKRVNGYEKAAAADIKAWGAQVRKALNSWLANFEDASAEILVEALEPTFDKSQELVPVLTGALKRSGFLGVGESRGKKVAEIGYGRGGVPFYAARVHEDLDVYHKPPTQAKFLEQPLLEDMNDIKNRVIFLMREAATR